jgi:hypothetical protein
MKKLTPEQAMQKAVTEALKFKTLDERKKILQFIRLLRKEWNGELKEGISLLTEEEAKRVLEEMARIGNKSSL